jgi:hypothetical protein
MTTVRWTQWFALVLFIPLVGCHRHAVCSDDQPTSVALIENLPCQGGEKLAELKLAWKYGHLITVRINTGFNSCDVVVLDRYIDGDRVVCDRTTWGHSDNSRKTERVYSVPAEWARDALEMTKASVARFRVFDSPESGSGPGVLFHVVPGECSPVQIHFGFESRFGGLLDTRNPEDDQRFELRSVAVLTQVLLDAQLQLFDRACSDIDGRKNNE